MKLDFRIGPPFDLRFSTSVHVTTDGMFTTTIPTEQAELMAEHGICLNVNKLGRIGFFKSDTLKGLRKNIGDAIDILCSEELVSDELVLRFSVETVCSYALPKDGIRFLPRPTQGVEDGTYWHGGTIDNDACHPEAYGLQVYVKPFRKRVYVYKTGKERAAYERHDGDSRFSDPRGSDLDWLATTVSMCPPKSHRARALQEIPATPENCAFFRSLLESLFALNEKLKPFLNAEGIQQLALQGVNLLGPAEPAKEMVEAGRK